MNFLVYVQLSPKILFYNIDRKMCERKHGGVHIGKSGDATTLRGNFGLNATDQITKGFIDMTELR